MHVLSIACVLICGACSGLAKPYKYSYYISSPTHYQTVEVSDEGVSANGAQFPARSNEAANPAFRQGRGEFGINQNHYPARRYPIDQNGPAYRQGWEPNYRDISDRELDPLFNQGGRVPQNRGGVYPHQRGPYEGDFNYRFNQINPNQQIPSFEHENFNFYRRYPQGVSSNPEFRTRTQLSNPQYSAFNQRAALQQEIDESRDTDKEAVTTTRPCSFCGVDRVNSRDGINGDNSNPDSEPVEAKKVGGKSVPQFAVENSSIVTPASVVIPYYVLA